MIAIGWWGEVNSRSNVNTSPAELDRGRSSPRNGITRWGFESATGSYGAVRGKVRGGGNRLKEYFDKSRSAKEAYGKELRGDTWWLASVTSGCTALFFLFLYAFIGWLKKWSFAFVAKLWAGKGSGTGWFPCLLFIMAHNLISLFCIS